MKTIDTKSLLLGAAITLLFLTLTSGKLSDEDNGVKLFSRGLVLDVYNPKTNTLYEYNPGFNSNALKENPYNTYKISPDGSSVKLQ